MATAPSVTEDEATMLSIYFEKCVISAAGGKKLTDEKKKEATGKAVMKMLEPLMGKADATFCEGGVVTKLSDKTRKCLSVETFKTNFFPELATYATKNIVSLKKSNTTAEAYQKKLLAKVKTELEKEKDTKGNAKVVDRLTDPSKYGGAHKERFNEDGTGKGTSGRKDEVVNSGYVGNYKGANTFDKK